MLFFPSFKSVCPLYRQHLRASSTPGARAVHTEATWAFLGLEVLTAAGVAQRPDKVVRESEVDGWVPDRPVQQGTMSGMWGWWRGERGNSSIRFETCRVRGHLWATNLESWSTPELVSLAKRLVLYLTYRKVNGSDFHFTKVTLAVGRKMS